MPRAKKISAVKTSKSSSPSKNDHDEDHTVAELRDMAKDLGLTSYHRLRKAELKDLIQRAMAITSNSTVKEATNYRDWEQVFSGSRKFIKYQGRKYKCTHVQREIIQPDQYMFLTYLINVDNSHNILAVIGYLDPTVPGTSLNWGRWENILVKKIS